MIWGVFRQTALAEFWKLNVEMAEVVKLINHARTIAESEIISPRRALIVVQAFYIGIDGTVTYSWAADLSTHSRQRPDPV